MGNIELSCFFSAVCLSLSVVFLSQFVIIFVFLQRLYYIEMSSQSSMAIIT